MGGRTGGLWHRVFQGIGCFNPDQSPLQAARMMVKDDIGRLTVVDQGNLIGIVTRSDVMMYFYDLLPAWRLRATEGRRAGAGAGHRARLKRPLFDLGWVVEIFVCRGRCRWAAARVLKRRLRRSAGGGSFAPWRCRRSR
ncbi:MAG: CBS domain-containing protein [Desulfobacteraceae bacterium]